MPGHLDGDLRPLPEANPYQWRLSYWFVRHRLQFHRWTVRTFIVVDALLLGFAAWGFVPILRDPHAVSRSAAAIEALPPLTWPKPQPVQVGSVTTISIGSVVNLIGTLSNVNQDRVAVEVRYAFSLADGQETAEQSTWLYPGQVRYVAALGVSASTSSLPTLVVHGTRFERVSPGQTLPRVDWELGQIQLDQPSPTQPGRVSFTVISRNLFIVRRAPFLVVTLGGGRQPVGVAAVELSNVRPNESRTAVAPLYQAAPGAAEAAVEPGVSPYDASAWYFEP